jgi:hypothetical protein
MNYHHQTDRANPENVWDVVSDPVKEKQPAEVQRGKIAVQAAV